MSKALPKRPFLLRAMHQWITECGHTPHVIVDVARDGTEVPRAYVKDGKIVLNLSEGATQRLRLGNDEVEFDARFAGVVPHLRFPVSAGVGVFPRQAPPPRPPGAPAAGGRGRRAPPTAESRQVSAVPPRHPGSGGGV